MGYHRRENYFRIFQAEKAVVNSLGFALNMSPVVQLFKLVGYEHQVACNYLALDSTSHWNHASRAYANARDR